MLMFGLLCWQNMLTFSFHCFVLSARYMSVLLTCSECFDLYTVYLYKLSTAYRFLVKKTALVVIYLYVLFYLILLDLLSSKLLQVNDVVDLLIGRNLVSCYCLWSVLVCQCLMVIYWFTREVLAWLNFASSISQSNREQTVLRHIYIFIEYRY